MRLSLTVFLLMTVLIFSAPPARAAVPQVGIEPRLPVEARPARPAPELPAAEVTGNDAQGLDQIPSEGLDPDAVLGGAENGATDGTTDGAGGEATNAVSEPVRAQVEQDPGLRPAEPAAQIDHEYPVDADKTLLPGAEDTPAGELESGFANDPASLPAAAPGVVPATKPPVVFDANVQAANDHLLRVEQELGNESLGLVEPLHELALAQFGAGQHEAAATTLQREVGILEKYFGPYSKKTAPPLSLLGDVYLASGKYEDAIDTFQHAQHLIHRSAGVYSLEQLDYVEKMSLGFLAMKKYGEADRHNRLSFFVSERQLGENSPELVPAIMKMADWLRRSGKVRESREHYTRAVKVLEAAYGPDHPSLIEPLVGLGVTTHKKGQYRKQRERALQRTIKIVEANPEIDTADRARSWARMGDFYIMMNDRKRAAEAYGTSWSVLNVDESLPEEHSRLFSEPVVLNFPARIWLLDHTPGTPIDGFNRSLVEFEIEVEFELSIGTDGRVLEVRAIDLEANPSTARQIRRYIREARFRPRMVDGKPVRTDNFRLKKTLTIIRPKV